MLFANNPELSGGPLNPEIYDYFRYETEEDDFCEHFFEDGQDLLEEINTIAETDGLLATGESIDIVETIGENDRLGIEDIGERILPAHFSAGATLHRYREEYLFRHTSRSDYGKSSHFLQIYNNDFVENEIIPGYVRGGATTVIGSLLVAKQTREYCEATEYTLRSNNVLKMIVRHIDMHGSTSTFVSSDENARSFALFSLGDVSYELVDV